MSGPEDSIALGRTLVEESQKEEFPYFVNPGEVFNLKIQVNKGVFSPKYAKGYSFFTPRLPDFADKKVLEIGSGHGVSSCYIAQSSRSVLATDISAAAVENTLINAAHNSLTNIEGRVSDVYSALNTNEKFDAIYWNVPWIQVSADLVESISIEERGVFDPDYQSISKFILEGHEHLAPGGSLYLGFGDHGADVERIELLIQEAGLQKIILADEEFQPASIGTNSPTPLRMRLYKLTPKN